MRKYTAVNVSLQELLHMQQSMYVISLINCAILMSMAKARFMLNTQESWQPSDGKFNMEDFYDQIVGLFEGSEAVKKWGKDTLAWWNR